MLSNVLCSRLSSDDKGLAEGVVHGRGRHNGTDRLVEGMTHETKGGTHRRDMNRMRVIDIAGLMLASGPCLSTDSPTIYHVYALTVEHGI